MGGALQGQPGGFRALFTQVYRFIELNPVRAGMVSDPADYRWSSYRAVREVLDCAAMNYLLGTGYYPATRYDASLFARVWIENVIRLSLIHI